MLSLLRHELRVRRGGIIGWSIGLSLYAAMYTAFYPALPTEMLELDFEDIAIYQAFGDMSMGSFAGYMASSVFNFIALLLGIYAVVSGVGALAGEEDNGTLELLVTLPLPRWQLVLAKALALAVSVLVILLVVSLAIVGTFAVIQTQITTNVTAPDLLFMTLRSWPITMVFTMMSLLLGAFLPGRRMASATAAALLVVSFFGNNLAGMFQSLRPIRLLSPFNYHNTSASVLTDGAATGDVLVLLTAAVVLLLLAILSFQKRNITVGAWLWQRPSRTTGG